MQETRYSRVAMAFHWLIGLALFGEIAFGFLLDTIAPRNTPARAEVINLHKFIGLALGLLVLLRLLWRLGHRAPAWPATIEQWQRSAAVAVHRGLYALMIVVPLSGYVASNFSKHGLKLYGLVLRPWGPDLPAVYGFFNTLHDVASYALVALIAGHAAMALKHLLIDHDGVFARMWPWPEAES